MIPQSVPKYITQHAWQAYVCYVDPDKAPMTRNEIMENLQAKGIATRPGTHAVHMLGFIGKNIALNQRIFLVPMLVIKIPWPYHYIINGC